MKNSGEYSWNASINVTTGIIEEGYSSPEDTILAKLRWAKLSGGSEKQFTDALRVYEVQYGRLGIDYLEDWAKKLEVESLWERLVNEAEIV